MNNENKIILNGEFQKIHRKGGIKLKDLMRDLLPEFFGQGNDIIFNIIEDLKKSKDMEKLLGVGWYKQNTWDTNNWKYSDFDLEQIKTIIYEIISDKYPSFLDDDYRNMDGMIQLVIKELFKI